MALIDINDDNYPIVSITLYKEYGTDFNLCMKEQKLIAQKYEKILGNTRNIKKYWKIRKNNNGKTRKRTKHV